MANPFLATENRDIETAIMLEQAIVHDIGKAVAYTDGDRIFINTADNLFELLPNYNNDFLKWLLWHERYHKELRHHNRFFKYLEELEEAKMFDEFHIPKQEVNIIMDILVHDSIAKLFPELVPIATENLAQMRDRNSLKHTFKSITLEEMLSEYKEAKETEEKAKEGDEGEESDEKTEGEEKKEKPKTPPKKKRKPTSDDKEDKPTEDTASPEEETEPEHDPEAKEPEDVGHHDETDWSKLEELDDKEFITQEESDEYVHVINKLKTRRIQLGKLTETLNGLVTSTRMRTYSKPSTIIAEGGAILKGSRPGRTRLKLCFDCSGSMGRELQTFKDIITRSIPQALSTPCEWFTCSYGKGVFKDMLSVDAQNGFNDDGDRVIDLCWKAEQAGYSPIGITDGGGGIGWSEDKLKQLKRTVLVGQSPSWLALAKKLNPKIQTLDL